ncbi:MAG: SgcJ/EcaC family oxidoreductase [Candidatus Acidiferrales bacterium]
MKWKRQFLLFLVSLSFSVFVTRCAMAFPQEDHAKDRAAIELTLQRSLNAWNTHDAHAFAMTFTEEADFTNVAGTHAHGRAKVEEFHAPIFASIFKESRLTAKIRSIRFLGPNLAVVDVDWEMTGAKKHDGTPIPYRRGLLDWVMARQSDGAWLIEVMHNTDLTNYPTEKK